MISIDCGDRYSNCHFSVSALDSLEITFVSSHTCFLLLPTEIKKLNFVVP
jgi:hypothetical protein